MSRQYRNIYDFLEDNNYDVQVSEEDFISTKSIEYKCLNGHTTKMAVTSFINKKSKYKDDYSQLCSTCVKNTYIEGRFINEKENILQKTGHTLLSLSNRENALYICGTCRSENKSNLSNLQTNLGRCPQCQNQQFKNTISIVNNNIKDTGVKILDYKNNKDVLAKCICGKVYKTRVNDIKRNKLCSKCKIYRTETTNIEKYGCRNVFQNKEIKEKINYTCLEKYGVRHHMQNSAIFSKSQKSCFSKKEYTFPSGKKTYVRGYEPYCINDLLKSYTEDEIVTETVDIPIVKYKKHNTKKNAIYYPDILLPDKLIEVKSLYTLEKDIENNILKIKACLKLGYSIELRVYSDKSDCIYCKLFTSDDIKRVGVVLKRKFNISKPYPNIVFVDD